MPVGGWPLYTSDSACVGLHQYALETNSAYVCLLTNAFYLRPALRTGPTSPDSSPLLFTPLPPLPRVIINFTISSQTLFCLQHLPKAWDHLYCSMIILLSYCIYVTLRSSLRRGGDESPAVHAPPAQGSPWCRSWNFRRVNTSSTKATVPAAKTAPPMTPKQDNSLPAVSPDTTATPSRKELDAST